MIFSTSMSTTARVLFALAGIVPLLAPYELLVRPDWPDALSIAWVLAALVSLGALAVTVLLLCVAVFGLDQRVEFHVKDRMVQVTTAHLLVRPRTVCISFPYVAGINVVCHDWSDGPSTYDLRLTSADGTAIDFGDFRSMHEAESVRSSLLALLRE